jgi:hypothetical protein
VREAVEAVRRHARRFVDVVACVLGLWWVSGSLAAQRGAPATTAPIKATPGAASLDPRSLTADLPFPMAPVALPQIPSRAVRITDHGARGDGITLNTEAIAAAIAACVKAGGGRVVVPRGIFLTGPVELKSRVELHLEPGALPSSPQAIVPCWRLSIHSHNPASSRVGAIETRRPVRMPLSCTSGVVRTVAHPEANSAGRSSTAKVGRSVLN